ncbi:MAG: aspartate/glutamate racemase family protein [Ideonella sp.]|nr:aspartate/glutamate racemase family protein [Ideonella sp.]
MAIACNTATAHAIGALRQRGPGLPIVGTEPGIKPAVTVPCPSGRIGVMATTGTINSARYQALIQRHAGAAQVFSQACPGLVNLIGNRELDSPALQALLQELCQPLLAAQVDIVLLGCTHYPLIQAQIQAALGRRCNCSILRRRWRPKRRGCGAS